ncbi:hypothetical protein YPPY64_4655 [Yersinia pestis PY-64]|nr:hypothetical protein YpF1991016_4488 [Yersinia pestis biovar Orientalis str. F1991016]EIR01113.1 hypothetical protein YPPY06_4534 [Yersinia pestis PY-06]EIR27138.1 hypothetical protein YPPY11_4633 [Yersinia pestis PY-11]EIR55275.1 hypothetical protein YPPY16_4485 [Yersinia pestis PY-16]EIR69728.1 hypothetical protein YPPY29_4326 [Yersinia pestis PY-29]EIR87242.1 hypothetical protein YPPY45_4367 [Yersinia pestis PY-45]EIS26714.1 hypothetical protein YPPY56_4570 [Yersinia pestis PY-56]EIS38
MTSQVNQVHPGGEAQQPRGSIPDPRTGSLSPHNLTLSV